MTSDLPLLPDAPLPLVIGHRGYPSRAPENTMSSFQKAFDCGVPAIELDVHRCLSGELVIIHDFSTGRICGEDHVVKKTPYSVLRNLDAGKHFSGAFTGERIPLLTQVFERFGSGFFYDIEIKERGYICGLAEREIVELIRDFGLTDRCILSSFNPLSLKEVRKTGFKRTALIFSPEREVPWFLRRGQGRFICRPAILKPSKENLRLQSSLFSVRKHGYGLAVWTINDAAEAAEFAAKGIKGIISNYPAEIMEELRNRTGA